MNGVGLSDSTYAAGGLYEKFSHGVSIRTPPR